MKLNASLGTGIKLMLTALLVALCLSGPASAQDLLTKGAISGKVTDATGAVIPNAKITITGDAGARTVTANAEGEFEAQNLVVHHREIDVCSLN